MTVWDPIRRGCGLGPALCTDPQQDIDNMRAEEFAKKKGLIGMFLRSQTLQEKTDAMFQKCVSAEKTGDSSAAQCSMRNG